MASVATDKSAAAEVALVAVAEATADKAAAAVAEATAEVVVAAGAEATADKAAAAAVAEATAEVVVAAVAEATAEVVAAAAEIAVDTLIRLCAASLSSPHAAAHQAHQALPLPSLCSTQLAIRQLPEADPTSTQQHPPVPDTPAALSQSRYGDQTDRLHQDQLNWFQLIQTDKQTK